MRDAPAGEVGELCGPGGVGPLPDVQPHVSLDECEGVRWKGPAEDGEIERRTEKRSPHPLHVPPGFQGWIEVAARDGQRGVHFRRVARRPQAAGA